MACIKPLLTQNWNLFFFYFVGFEPLEGGACFVGCCGVRRTHPQVGPYDAVVGASLSHAAPVRRPRHSHGAAPAVVLGPGVRLQRG